MNTLPKRILWRTFFVVGLLASLGFTLPAQGRRAAAQSPQDILDAVNHLRQVNGLPAYRSDPALMAAAQEQADWQAANGSITHTGQGGTRPKERAAAAGYGNGGTIFVSENIAGGYQMSVEEAIALWQGDDLHLNTMLGDSYRDAGAGVAVSGETVYYVLLAGYVAGEQPPPAATNVAPATAVEGGAASIQTVTPRPDGSVVHIVQPGETLWSIAQAYKVGLAQLMSQNGLSANTVLYPGNRLIIHRAGEITPQPTDTPAPPTATPTPSGPRPPTATPAWMGPPATVVITLPAAQPAATRAASPAAAGSQDWRRWAALFVGLSALGAILWLSRR